MTETLERPAFEPKVDHMPIEAVDHIQIVAGNARQSAYYYERLLGFERLAYAGPETGVPDAAFYLLGQGEVRLVIVSALHPDTPFARFCNLHGDGVRRVVLRVPDVVAAFEAAVSRGAEAAEEPHFFEDEHGRVGLAAIHMYGDVQMSFIERGDYRGAWMPGFVAVPGATDKPRGAGIAAIDHVVGNVELGKMNQWVTWFEKVLGFELMQHFTDAAISTEYSALMSKVMQNGSGKIKFPINEPAHGKRRSQIEEYLDFNHGPGVQHIALITGDICATVEGLRQRGVEFLGVPPSYYEDLWDRVGEIREDVKEIERLNIMVDRDDDGYLLQIFSSPVQDRPTMFFEIIQRRGSRGFGEGNFKALFEAIEREQDRRGNL